ncbi:TrlF family AAA-like ATPase [Pseudomonas fulva]|uniref:TrlF family AAA-like ATPase n=1 Tax=Pseudomonas fulva TaxID=47880 RepID=UPI003D002FE3
MDEKLTACLELSNGSRFYRGDLHIHSFKASHDVKDEGMIPEAIVLTAVAENLSIIAVADHNEIDSVHATVLQGQSKGVLVIPAIELSTPEGHLLCYFPTVELLRKFHGRLEIVDRGAPTSRCKNAMFACLEIIKELNGFGILAHVDGGNGLETNHPGGSPHKIDILCHPALLAIELKNVNSKVYYSEEDPDQTRALIGQNRIERLGLGARQYLARILSSDSHTLDALGRNASTDRRLTRYKMEAPTFKGLVTALQENDSRIRLESEIPDSTPFILAASLEGGYLTSQKINFSKNLNCIIGGRGSGKSTTFEAIRCLAGDNSDAEVIDSEVWPQQLYLYWQDEAGQQHSLRRPSGGVIENMDDPERGPLRFDIDCFGQGEASRIRESAKSDPLALLKYLDTFTDIDEVASHERECISDLGKLRTKILAAEQQVNKIPEVERLLDISRQQLAAFEAVQGAELVRTQRVMASEKEVRASLSTAILSLKQHIDTTSLAELLEDMRSSVANDEISIGRAEANSIEKSIEKFSNETLGFYRNIAESFAELEIAIATLSKDWAAKEHPLKLNIETKRSELEGRGVKLDMAHIARLTQQESQHKADLEKLLTWVPHLERRRADYAQALKARWNARKEVFNGRQRYAIKASRALAEVLKDLQVKLSYSESAYSQEAVSTIAKAMGWKTVSHNKAKALIAKLTLPGLLEVVARKKEAAFAEVLADGNVKMFTSAEAREIIEKLGDATVSAELEQCQVHDFPKLTVTRKADNTAQVRFIQRDFTQLSLGQQQSVLLALILSSDSKQPLIIDQPEDNLDSEFIVHTFVPVLRRAKERRQVIIVTHNANIAVLGDAEQLIVLKSNSEKSLIVARGSIDDDNARVAACKILEGAREAFVRRAKIYGVV